MNIEEFINWRERCFFCQDELEIFLYIGEESPRFSKQDDWLRTEHHRFKVSIHIKTGKIRNDGMANDVFHAYFDKSIIKLQAACRACWSHEAGGRYEYHGILIPNKNKTKIKSIEVAERIIVQKEFSINQSKIGGVLRIYSKSYHSFDSCIDLPYLDLRKVTPEILKNKVKTYTVFL